MAFHLIEAERANQPVSALSSLLCCRLPVDMIALSEVSINVGQAQAQYAPRE